MNREWIEITFNFNVENLYYFMSVFDELRHKSSLYIIQKVIYCLEQKILTDHF